MGTFAGVFTPSILTILGLILFLRLGYVVGAGGLFQALVIVAVANLISVLTSLSLAAVATNLRVKRGGDYYLISRTLGHEFGGAIGIVLFLAQSVSIAFYCIGFGEAVTALLPLHTWLTPQTVAALAVATLFVFSWLGADWATKLQYLIMIILAAALVSFFVGGIGHWNTQVLVGNWRMPDGGPPFWVLFALFFPAVTGFTQGVSMSGELADPHKSLPLGTFLAVGLSILVYFAASVVLAASLPSGWLSADYNAMNRVAVVGELIVAGVVAATISSAMASFLGAPRILQSLAGDGIFKVLAPFAHGSGPSGNPRRGVLLAAGIAFATVAVGNLDLIAPIVTMFFLISYGLINYATYFEARSASPSFRPTFRFFDRRVSLVGALICFGAMAMTDLAASVAALAVLVAIYQYLRRTAFRARWADGQRSYHLHEVRSHLLAATEDTDHPRDWRPNILAVSEDHERRRELLRFASWLEGDSGFTTVVKIVENADGTMQARRKVFEDDLAADIEAAGVRAFPLVVAMPGFDAGMRALVQTFGIGPLRANTVLFNWSEERGEGDSAVPDMAGGSHLSAIVELGCNVVLLDAKGGDWEKLVPDDEGIWRIDIWWRDDASSRLSLLFAYLMTRTEAWHGTALRVVDTRPCDDADAAMESLRKQLAELRIDAEPVVAGVAEDTTPEALSRGAALVFLPFRIAVDGPLTVSGAALQPVLDALPPVALVLAAKDIEMTAEPEHVAEGEDAGEEGSGESKDDDDDADAEDAAQTAPPP